jgi:TolB protein
MFKFAVILLMFLTGNLYAITHIDITRGNIEPLPIAVNDLRGENHDDTTIGNKITQVINADLERSGLFRPIDQASFIERNDGRAKPQFASWRQINASVVVTGRVKMVSSDQIEVEFRLWDSFAETQIAGQSYTTAQAGWRRVAHKISDQIYKKLTGEEGYFDTRIVYIAESGPAKKRIKRLAVMDQDSENHKFLTDGRTLVLTPRFSPNMHQILYLSYARKTPRVYVRDIHTGKERVLGEFPGMTLAPRFSPDGKKVILSATSAGNTDIYVVDLQSGAKTRLTNDNAIDVSPSYSPDASKIVFNSDRGGGRQLYVMNADGSNVKRISFGSGSYTTPVWSPRGDWIAFTKKTRGSNFYIGVMKPDGSGERILTEGFLVEGPSWAPNGRVIVYARGEPPTRNRAAPSRIYSIDLTGYNEREIVTPIDGSDPAWSPLLP